MLDLSKIQFPIYPVNIETIKYEEGLKLIFQHNKFKVLDDTSREGNLARRRMQYELDTSVFMKRPLAKLINPIFRYSDMFQFLKKYRHFMDSNGKIFEYTLTKFVPLIYYKIKKFVEIPTGYYIELYGVHCRFYLNRVPKLEEHYAGLLKVDNRGYVLYELTDKHKPTTRRKI
jgi:hypothetical protein